MSSRSLDTAKARWISVLDRMPPKGKRLILRVERNGYVRAESGYRRDNWDGGFCTQKVGGGMAIQGVSHWIMWPRI